jgi:hypothetical protein
MNDDEQVSDGETNEAPVLILEEPGDGPMPQDITTIDQSWVRRNAIEYAIQAACYQTPGHSMETRFLALMEQAEVIYQFIIGGKE